MSTLQKSVSCLFVFALSFTSICLYASASPTGTSLSVSETAGIDRVGEILTSGIPIPRAADQKSVSNWAVTDASGSAVPAEFRILARWNAGLSADAPIQWALVSFPADVAADSAATYQLTFNGANVAPQKDLELTRQGNKITVNTGVASFVIGGSAEALFDEIRTSDGSLVAEGGAMSGIVQGVTVTHTKIRSVEVEHSGPLTATVIVKGEYDLPPVGDGKLASYRRYTFTAGSPSVIVRHVANWEGQLCGDISCEGVPNALRVTRLRDEIVPKMGTSRSVRILAEKDGVPLNSQIAVGQTASLRQILREARTDSLRYTANVPGATQEGQKADGGMLSIADDSAMLAVAYNHMHRYEPQALCVLENGSLAVDLADDRAWIGYRQGLFATFSVSVSDNSQTLADLMRTVWAPVNRPLRAWPAARWFRDSKAVPEIPVGELPENLQSYDTLIRGTLDVTMEQIDAVGFPGLMTFGLFPRYWGPPANYNEVDCSDGRITPDESWDNTYWCTTWTDYHNTVSTAPLWAIRTGEVEWLDELGFPGALRMLHTQIMQCAEDDGYFYCGQSPTGYGGYRFDFNSSHAYFENIFLYYWLTGDSYVVESVKRGATAMRSYLCSSRGTGSVCGPNDPPENPWIDFTGRVASQWVAAFRFVGLASDDASFLDDYSSVLGRAMTQFYVETKDNGKTHGFWLTGGGGGTYPPVSGPGTYSSVQLWLGTLYDMENLYRWQIDSNDAPLGDPAIRPSRVITAWARAMADYGSTVAPGGNGTPSGIWTNSIKVTWEGERLNGKVVSVTQDMNMGDVNLWDTGKSCLTATMVRAGQDSGDPDLAALGKSLTEYALNSASSGIHPLGKEAGLYLARLHAAVGRLAEPDVQLTPTPTEPISETPTATPTFLPTSTNTPVFTPTPTETVDPDATPTPDPAADINNDGFVDDKDLMILHRNWHTSP